MARTVERQLADWLITHSHMLYRVENGTIRQMVKPYLAAREELHARISQLQNMPTSATKEFRLARMQAQMAEIEATLSIAANEAGGTLGQTLAELASKQNDLLTGKLASVYRQIGVDIVSLPYAQIDWILQNPLIYQYRNMTPTDGLLWSNQQAVTKMRESITQSIIAGEDMRAAADQLLPSVRPFKVGLPLATVATRCEMIARSEILHVNNEVNRRIFAANQDVLGGVRYQATLDNRTCQDCAFLDGTEYSYENGRDHTGPQVPIHCRCRCVYAPITKSWQEMGYSKDIDDKWKQAFPGSAEKDYIKTYGSWLKDLDTTDRRATISILGVGDAGKNTVYRKWKMGEKSLTREELDKILFDPKYKPGRYQLWRKGKLKFESMVKDGRELTLEQLGEKLDQLMNS